MSNKIFKEVFPLSLFYKLTKEKTSKFIANCSWENFLRNGFKTYRVFVLFCFELFSSQFVCRLTMKTLLI